MNSSTCRWAVAAMLLPVGAMAQTGRITSGSYSVQSAANELSGFRDGAQVLSFRTLLQKPFEEFKRQQTPETRPCSWEQILEVVSLAGPWLGIRRDSYSYCKEAAHPAVDRALGTFDLSKAGRAIPMTELFSEGAIVSALSKDSVLAPYLGKQPATLAGLFAALPAEGVAAGDTPCTFELARGLTQFALQHVEGERVAVRVTLTPIPGPCRGLHPELGVLLPIPAALKGQPVVSPPAKSVKTKMVFEVR